MKSKKEKRTKEPITIDYENKKLSTIYFLPLLLLVGFVPLIVYAKLIDLSGTTQALYWTGQQQYLDFFSYWKSRWVIVLTAIALLTYIILYKQKKLPFKNLKQYYIPLGIYALFVIVSTIFAIDTQTALWGFVDMYQGMFVLLSYVTITFLTINFVNNERDVNLFVKAFLFLMIAEGILGISQYFGFDILQTGFGNKLILPGYLVVEDLSFSFGPKTIYGTLFNTNFVGSFATLMLPLSISFLLGSKTEKQRIISGLAVVLMIFTWIGCNSRAGYLGVAVSAVFALWLFRKVIFKNWKVSVGLVGVIIVLLIGLNSFSGGALVNRLKTFNVAEQIENIKAQNEKALKFEDITLGKDSFSIKTNLETLNFKLDNDKLYFLDESNNELEISQKRNEIKINDNRYRYYKITIPENYPGVTVAINWHTINFYISEDGVKVLGSGGRLTEPVIAEEFEPLDGLEGFMSGRGYIWSRTIPMFSRYFVKGSGSDNYPMAFPQDDFVAKLNTSYNTNANLVVDKPHNMYLQIAINTGVVSLIALLAVWILYIINSLKLYSKVTFDSLEKFIGASCFVSVIGYLIAGIFNDHIVSVSPLFWIILGIGISINMRLHKKIVQNEN
ncbi:O-antigen ligase family protein [Sedimentibacter sp. MB31-C6]|uniref:O-antigen ligase family protein n=1 Tax=Sedimentibacter sp. MB31-C6 TaxID=3109366 RepID=UPI002DDC93BE|nr:O-antigen ligase family protein [Sedimentibacter sp. MB36-C1]WSI03553.1 O-antigen ligase family protein [Sedimentibacter sp. MB36-C1]